MLPKPLLAALLVVPLTFAASPADRLSQAVDDLEALAAELQANQDETAALRDQLAALEQASEEHRRTLAAQAAAEERYAASVAELRAQAEASLRLAEGLQAQLARERAVTVWLWPAALVGGGLAVLEGFWLLSR